MLESEGFEDFAKIVDGGSGEYEFYVVSKYAVALYYEGVEKAEIFTIVEGYLDNPTQIETIQLVINNLQ